ncbi:hypothetical protein [Brachyspira pilosicoli]|uniref:hypothetical protein n=1 Tax=Brachyspira pilosicoli TaxID=52584 RepID=UPI0012F49F56|nr:hypothetical protein [Brachyspira pilosicoli]
MKKILLIFILIFSFSILSYGEKLKIGITNENMILHIYDDKTQLFHYKYGTIQIDNEQITILVNGIQDKKNQLGIILEEEEITLAVNKLLFQTEPDVYYIGDTDYNIDFLISSTDSYFFYLPYKHFKQVRDDDLSVIIASSKEVEGYTGISHLIKLLKVAEDDIKNYSSYKKYLK